MKAEYPAEVAQAGSRIGNGSGTAGFRHCHLGGWRYDGRTIPLKAGMTIRIPAKVKHNLVNTGTETLRTMISFSSGDRKTVFLEEQPAK